MLSFIPLPAFADNYIWLLPQPSGACVVDPGDASPVLDYLAANGQHLAAILVTHHHADHTGGVARLKAAFPHAVVHGPAGVASVDAAHADSDSFAVGDVRFRVIATPGHTLDHLCYYTPGALLSGDTLFGAGCGRLFEGSAEQMYASLARLAALPPDTWIYPAHEYTLANLAFARACDPDNPAVRARLLQDSQRRERGEPTLPVRLDAELASNPFLRSGEPALLAASTQHEGTPVNSALESFAILRRWKNIF
ncbi:hydroxyacylglutathione hydrolase [Crenobacter caeni]|uniref:Hydroxyacylglutathione hydrolase n=1 Tax=Crenobacter caeni TaxID=2705474 RepID=A0A6B2KNI3_9NEIS|nr:hydroxyacylglutathione hydrolase [Crenobacter caeni]NDV11745.1 hydroxyacylglutathione hydrolase [Crenobacter caeni]